MKRFKTFLCASGFAVAATQATAGCVKTPDPCVIDLGEYHIELPQSADNFLQIRFQPG